MTFSSGFSDFLVTAVIVGLNGWLNVRGEQEEETSRSESEAPPSSEKWLLGCCLSVGV